MTGRKHVVLLEVDGAQGTGFLIASDKLATALHVVAQLDENLVVVRDDARMPTPQGLITCTYYSPERGYWAELVEFDPTRDPFSFEEDYVVLTVKAGADAHIWPCADSTVHEVGARCSTYGFPVSRGGEGAPLSGELTGVHDPHSMTSSAASSPTFVPIHRARFQEIAGSSGYAPTGFSGAPLVVADRVVGIVRSFFPGSGDEQALAGTLNCTPVTPILLTTGIVATGIVATERPTSTTVELVAFEGPNLAPASARPFFCGRDHELAELERLLCDDNRVVCVVATGLGGIGKTYLAHEFVATRAPDRFPDGVAWLDGRRLETELSRVSRRFGWRELRDPRPAEANAFLSATLHHRDVLLVIDDFDPEKSHPDHVPRSGARCRTLVTSRFDSVDVDLDATKLELGVWTLDACRQYLRSRCEVAHSTDTELDELAEFVGRLPLGVRLLVSLIRRRRGLILADLLAGLRGRPIAWLDAHRGAHPGLAATFSSSYEALTSEARQVLLALAACARETRRDIVEAVSGVPTAGVLLDELYDRGLAMHTKGASAPWGMHDVVRMFVGSQSDYEAAELAQLAWANQLLDRDWTTKQHDEFDPYVNELKHIFWRYLKRDTDQAGGIYDTLGSYLGYVGRHSEAIPLGEALLEHLPAQSDRVPTTRQWLAISYQAWGSPERALELEQRALERAEAEHDDVPIPMILNNIGGAHIRLGQFGQAQACFIRAIALASESDDLAALASSLGNLGHLYEMDGRPEEALPLHERCLALNIQLHRAKNQAIALGHIGDCHSHLGDVSTALRHYQEALTIYEDNGVIDGQTSVLDSIATCHQLVGQIDDAIATHQRAIDLARAFGSRALEADRTGSMGVCQLSIGRVAEAIASFATAFSIDVEIGRMSSQAISLGNLGFCHQLEGQYEQAVDFHRRASVIDRELGNYGGQLRHLKNLVACYGELEREGDVAATLSEALKLAEAQGDGINQARLLVHMAMLTMDVEAARKYLERALALAIDSDTRDRELLDRVRDLLADLDERSS